MRETFYIYLENPVMRILLQVQNCGRLIFANTTEHIFFSLEIRVNFGRP